MKVKEREGRGGRGGGGGRERERERERTRARARESMQVSRRTDETLEYRVRVGVSERQSDIERERQSDIERDRAIYRERERYRESACQSDIERVHVFHTS